MPYDATRKVWFWNFFTHLTEHFDVEFECLFHQRSGFFESLRSGDTAGDVRSVRGKIRAGVFNDDRVLSHPIPLSNSGSFHYASQGLGWQFSSEVSRDVTSPTFVGCLK